ncbi:hypothetical protein [Actinoplanes regularis]|uniref:hypothetical protein n=1 Tax=Actinoplanes regularis TaxID=52697 RepID=UPI0024A116B5|nr:hypothetical protein [Actinoplanes regularis]GLW28309.1 hypothetical protein Areg01_12490 [Actinoplanes regularis]
MGDVSESIAGDDQHKPGDLVDVSHVSLTDLVAAHGDSPVSRSIARLRRNLDDPNGVLSAFSSFIDEP